MAALVAGSAKPGRGSQTGRESLCVDFCPGWNDITGDGGGGSRARWTVEQCFEEGKGEVGLDEYEVRSWHGWFRRITLSMLALAFLTALRVNDEENTLKKSLSRRFRSQSQKQLTLFKTTWLLISQLWFPSVLSKSGGFSFVS
jgi:hypothetical protein